MKTTQCLISVRLSLRSRRRLIALVTLAAVVHAMLNPSARLVADPRFKTFKERGFDQVQRYVNRADRLSDEQSWTNYVATGVAYEKALWEDEALEEIRQAVLEEDRRGASKEESEDARDRLLAQLTADEHRWDEDSDDFVEKERGEFRARIKTGDLMEDLRGDTSAGERKSLFDEIVSEAEAAVASVAGIDLALWDSIVDPARVLRWTQFKGDVDQRMEQIRQGETQMGADERAAFDAEMNRVTKELEDLYHTEENLYLLRGRNNYIAARRVNDLSARYVADASSASAIGDAILDEARAEATAQTDSMLATLNSTTEEGLQQGQTGDILAKNWERQIEALIEAGMQKWGKAEEDLYAERLTWMNASKKNRAEAETIWKRNHDELKKRREAWLVEARKKIDDGRNAWDAKIAEFQTSRAVAGQDLAKFVEDEKARRDAALGQLGSIVKGGGSALVEAKEALRFFQDLRSRAESGDAMIPFYDQQIANMKTSIATFQALLTQAETRLSGNMNSDATSSGFLKDRRIFAADLMTELLDLMVAGGNFETALKERMGSAASAERYLLYLRDLRDIIARNADFAAKAKALSDAQELKYRDAGVAKIADLRRRVEAMDSRYDDQREELLKIIDKKRDDLTMSDEAKRLEAIQSDIDHWFTASTDRDGRLKAQVKAYFDDGLVGYYLSGNENDPYLMTRAEYDWELLRRERDYLAKRYQRAEEVKRYAELAETYDASLEMASVTRDRAAIALYRENLREAGYLLLKGDLPNAAAMSRLPEGERLSFDALLMQRGVDVEAVKSMDRNLDDELDVLTLISGLSPGAPDRSAIAAAIAAIDAHLGGLPGADAGGHRLKTLGDRLRAVLLAMDDPAVTAETLTNRMNTLRGAATAVASEVAKLRAEYGAGGFLSEIANVRKVYDGPSVKDRSESLQATQSEMNANARSLALAQEELNAAREAYGSVLDDYNLLVNGDPANLVQMELKNAAAALAGVLNGMKQAADMKAPENAPENAIEKGHRDYYRILSERSAAERDQAFTEAALAYLTSVEAARVRSHRLGELLADSSGTFRAALGSADAGVRAAAVLAETDLLKRSDAGPAASHTIAVSAWDALNGAAEEWAKLGQDLAQARSDGSGSDSIEKLVADRERAAGIIDRSIEILFSTIRQEERVRSDLLVSYAGGAATQTAALDRALADERKRLMTESYGLGSEAARSIRSLLETSGAEGHTTFAELLAAANARVTSARASRGVDVNAGLAGGASYESWLEGATASREYEKWSMARDWLIANRDAIDYANKSPDADNPLTKADRWAALVDYAVSQADRSAVYDRLRDEIPKSPADDRVGEFRTSREALRAALRAVLSRDDTGMRTAYLALSAEERDILARYGAESAVSAADLRSGLIRADRAMTLELAGLEHNYESVYLRERAIQAHADLAEQQKRLADISMNLDEARLVLRRLEEQRAKDDASGGASASLAAEVQRLTDLVAELEGSRKTAETKVQQALVVVQELASPGHGSPLGTFALSQLTVEQGRLGLLSWLAGGLWQKEAEEKGQVSAKATEQLKAMIGFFQTDEAGAILRDSDGRGIVAGEFGTASPDVDLSTLVNGGKTATQLQTWATRILSYLKDPAHTDEVPTAVRAAAEELRASLVELAAARAIIAHRGTVTNGEYSVSSDSMLATARSSQERYTKLNEKLGVLSQFEASLKSAVEKARASGGDPAAAALGILEAPAHQYVYRLFLGYGPDGVADGIADGAVQNRVQALLNTADRLRRDRANAAVAAIAAEYGERLTSALSAYGSSAGLIALDPDEYLKDMKELNPDPILAKIEAIPASTFHTQIWSVVNALPASSYLYRSHIYSLIQTSPLTGQDLKAYVVQGVRNYEMDLRSSLTALTGESFGSFMYQADIEVKDSIASFIESYRHRGTRAREVITAMMADLSEAVPAADGVPVEYSVLYHSRDTKETEDLSDDVVTEEHRAQLTFADAKDLLLQEISSALGSAAFTSILRDLSERFASAEDLATLRTAVAEVVAGLSDPSDADVAKASDYAWLRTLRSVLAYMDAADAIDEKKLPVELRDFALLRARERATERYESYRTLRDSDVPAERDRAVLDLRGLGGDFARSVLIQDFDEWSAAHPIEMYLSAAGGSRSIQDYLGEYMSSRHTSAALLPRGGADLVERVAQREYQRMKALAEAGPASDIWANLDERSFFVDFRTRLLVAVVTEYVAAHGSVITGDTTSARRESFRPTFDALLGSAEGARDGLSLRDRLVASGDLENAFNLAFSYLETREQAMAEARADAVLAGGDGGAAAAAAGRSYEERYFPSAIATLSASGELDGPVKGAEAFLPEAWKKRAAELAAKNSRDLLRGLGDAHARVAYEELARIETIEDSLARAGKGYVSAATLSVSSADLDRLIAQAGYGDLVSDVRLRNAVQRAIVSAAVSSMQQSTGSSLRDILRDQNVTDFTYASREAREALEEFLASEGRRPAVIEEKFFARLGKSSGELRMLAKNERGRFFAGLIGYGAGDNAYHDALPTQRLKDAFADLRTVFWGSLSDEERAALLANRAQYGEYFQLRSGQELVASGIFESVESTLFTVLAARTDDAFLQFARDNRSAVVSAFLQAILTKNPSAMGDAIPEAQRSALKEVFDEAFADMDPSLRSMVQKESVLVTRFIDHFLEEDSRRRELIALLEGTPDEQDFSRVSSRRLAEISDAVSEAQYALVSRVDADVRALSDVADDYSTQLAVASRLATFARERGQNVQQNRFAHYRTYVGSEEGAWKKDYRKYVADAMRNDAYLAEDQHAEIFTTPPTDANHNTLKSYSEFRQGMLVEHGDVTGVALQGANGVATVLSGNYEGLLTSDARDMSVRTVSLDQGTPAASDDVLVQVRRIRGIQAPTTHGGGAASDAAAVQAELTATYYAHIANTFIEAVTRVDLALANLVVAAVIADASGPASESTLKDQVTALKTGKADLAMVRTAFENEHTRAVSMAAESGPTNQQAKRDALDGVVETAGKSRADLAASGRRKQMRDLISTTFIASVYAPVEQKYTEAKDKFQQVSNEAASLQQTYATGFAAYMASMDAMSDEWRLFSAAQDDYERRLAVKQYAETPYLFAARLQASETDHDEALKDYADDAREEYSRAKRVLDQANSNLNEAGYSVQIEANLERFTTLLSGLSDAAGAASIRDPLTEAETTRLGGLRDRSYRNHEDLSPAEVADLTQLENRAMYAQYRDLIETRADYIKHTMRMIRLHRAQSVVSDEIARLRNDVADRKEAYDESLRRHFGDFEASDLNDTEKAEAIAARNAVYQRLAAQYLGGSTNYAMEFRAWFWGQGAWMEQYADLSVQGPLTFTPTQINEGVFGFLSAGMIPGADRASLGKWMARGKEIGYSFAAFSGFQSAYFGLLTSMGQRDMARFEQAMVVPVWQAVISVAAAGIATAYATSLFTLGTSLLAVPALLAATAAAQAQIAMATMKVTVANIATLLAAGASILAGDPSKTGVAEVVEKQRLYEESLSKLDYFTKIPDAATLKHRIEAFGERSGLTGDYHYADDGTTLVGAADARLYMLDDEDLKLLAEMQGATLVSVGASGQTLQLSDRERLEAIDGTQFKEDAEYRDSMGREYDPASLVRPGDAAFAYLTLKGGSYSFEQPKAYNSESEQYEDAPVNAVQQGLLGKRFTRIKLVDDAGNYSYALARIVESTEPDPNLSVYDAGQVLMNLVDHGKDLRDERLTAYLAAGEARSDGGNNAFVLAERDRTMKGLLDQAGDGTDGEGGRQYAGYAMMADEYLANQQSVFDRELAQRQAIQEREWALRAAELQARKDEWESRMNSIIRQGSKAWTSVEDRYLGQWRKWQHDYDRKVADGNKAWDAKIAQHYLDRAAWEEDVRARAASAATEEVMSDTISRLNAELSTIGRNAGVAIEPIDMVAEISSARDNMLGSLPGLPEQLADVKKDIENFKTHLAMSEMSGADLTGEATAMAARFRSTMQQQETSMRAYANARIMAEYEKMLEKMMDSLEQQNAAIRQQTESAALASGFIKQGQDFVKQGKLVSTAVGLVEGYRDFDVRGAFATQLAGVRGGSIDALGNPMAAAAQRGSYGEDHTGDMPAFLRDADTVQVEAYFHTQRLILEKALETIVGTGSANQRQNNPTQENLGLFGLWVGKPAGSSDISKGVQGALPFADGDMQDALDLNAERNDLGFSVNNVDLLKYAADPGSGELGSGGMRHEGSTVWLGFYSKLDLVSRFIDGKDAKRMENRGIPGPLLAMLNQFDPITMVANGAQNVAFGTKFYGQTAETMWGAQLLSAAKGAAPALGLINPALGLVGTAVASTIHVDVRRGTSYLQTTDRTAVDLALAIAPYGAGVTAGALGWASSAETVVKYGGYAAATIGGSLRYDANGNLQGGYDGAGAATALGAALIGGSKLDPYTKMLLRDLFSTTATTLHQYDRFMQGHENGYAQLANPGFDRLGALAGGLAIAYDQARVERAKSIIADGQAIGLSPEQISNGLRNAGLDDLADAYENEITRRSNETDQSHRLAHSAAGLARRREEEMGDSPPDNASGLYRTTPDGRRIYLNDRGELIDSKGWYCDENGDRLYSAETGEGGFNPRRVEADGSIIVKGWQTANTPGGLRAALGIGNGGDRIDDWQPLNFRRGKDGQLTTADGKPIAANMLTILPDGKGRLLVTYDNKNGHIDSATYAFENGQAYLSEAYRYDHGTQTDYHTAYRQNGTTFMRVGETTLPDDVVNPATGKAGGFFRTISYFGPRNGEMHYGIDIVVGANEGLLFGNYSPVRAKAESYLPGGMTDGEPSDASSLRGIFWQKDEQGALRLFDSRIGKFRDLGETPGLSPDNLSLPQSGNMVVLKATSTDGTTYHMQFMHMPEIPAAIESGTKTSFAKGEYVGGAGATGYAQAIHVHFGVYTEGAAPKGISADYFLQNGNRYYIDPIYFLKNLSRSIR